MDAGRQKIKILGVDVDDMSQKRAVDFVLKLAKSKKRGNYVVTVNSEFVMFARKNPNFAKILKNANLSLADGWWVAKSKLMLGGRSQERVTGVDLIEKVCEKIGKKPVTVGFLGGFGSVAEAVKKRQIMHNPSLKVVISEPGDPTIGYDLRLKKQIDSKGGVDVLFVAYGMGRQEFFIERNRKKLNVGVFIGVGGAFDYLAGVKRRAPKFVQNAGFEWLWRLASEPTRIWRQRVLPVYFLMIISEIFSYKFSRKVSL